MTIFTCFGIKRISDNLWFGGFGPEPEYEVRWFSKSGAYPFAEKESAEMQAYLLERKKSNDKERA